MSFGRSSGTVNREPLVWQDREVRFDVMPHELALTDGEKYMDLIDSVEDTKGNNGDKGMLKITNLRLIWTSHTSEVMNLSIGWNCVLSVSVRMAQSKLRGGLSVDALFILAKTDTRFEFIFTSVLQRSARLFSTVQSVHRAYQTSKLYRDLKLRGALLNNGVLKLLPKEQTIDTITGVWNLSSEQGNLGSFVITNVRLVWFAQSAHSFNASLPWIQIDSISLSESRFGKALVIQTTSFTLGFRVDNQTHPLTDLYELLSKLHSVYIKQPNFGVELESEHKSGDISETRSKQLQSSSARKDRVKVKKTSAVDRASIAAFYSADGPDSTSKRKPVFNPTLGLAVEKYPDSLRNVLDLWHFD